MISTLWSLVGLCGLAASPVPVPAARVPEPPPLALHVNAFIRQHRLEVEVATAPAIFPPARTDVQLTVAGPAGVALRQAVTLDPKSGQGLCSWDDKQLPAGPLTIAATATNRETGRTAAAEKAIGDALHPAWLNTAEGNDRWVPPPWTDIQIDGFAVKPWGRVYRFDRSLLPTDITSRGASVLAGPVRLVGRIGGKTVGWNDTEVRYRWRRPDAVLLEGHATAAGLTLRGTTQVEYDGMLRADLELAPDHGPLTLEGLTLEVPLRQQYARYLYHYPGRWGSVANSSALPPEGWKHAFKPCVWLGDEDRGLEWFCESDQNWLLADPRQAITIDREAGSVVLRCHLIDHPVKVETPLAYTFGLQATPVKEPEKTVWDYRITHDGGYGLESEPAAQDAAIVYAGRGHLRAAQGTFECWYRPAYDSEYQIPLAQRFHPENHNLLTIRWGGPDVLHGTNCGLYYNGHVQGMVVWSRRNGRVLLNPGVPVDWKGGQWHHLALSWSDKVRLYIDGQLSSETPNAGMIPGAPEEATIEIGGSPVAAAIDEVRILGVARVPAVPTGPAQADAETLLLDHFEDYDTPGARTAGEVRGLHLFGEGRFGRGLVVDAGGRRTRLEALADQGVRTVCFHEHWSPYQGYPSVTDENRPKLHSLVEACHQHGVSLLLYMSREMADNAPEWELYNREALLVPRHGGYKRQPAQTDWYFCWRSPWKEFCLDHLARLLDEMGHDGWYLDGPEAPQPCANRSHGCGYVGPDGKVHPTWDIFATRDFMKRLYVLTRRRRPGAQLNIHNSTVMTMPTLGWGTSYWSGEQLDSVKPPAQMLDVLPLDAFRTEFMGRQWGVPAEFLVYENRPYRSQEVLACTLLHGVLVRPSGPESLARIAALWKVYDRFPLAQKTMYPYWDAAGPVRCEPAGVFATAYVEPAAAGKLPSAGELLLLASNLGQQDAQARIHLDLGRLHVDAAQLTAWDDLTQAAVPLNGSTLELPIGRWQYRVLRVGHRPAQAK